MNNARKHATKWYAVEKEKKSQGKKGLSTELICKHVNKTYNTNLYCIRIGNFLTKGFIGVTLSIWRVKKDIRTSLQLSHKNQQSQCKHRSEHPKMTCNVSMVIEKQESDKLPYNLFDHVLLWLDVRFWQQNVIPRKKGGSNGQLIKIWRLGLIIGKKILWSLVLEKWRKMEM